MFKIKKKLFLWAMWIVFRVYKILIWHYRKEPLKLLRYWKYLRFEYCKNGNNLNDYLNAIYNTGDKDLQYLVLRWNAYDITKIGEILKKQGFIKPEGAA